MIEIAGAIGRTLAPAGAASGGGGGAATADGAAFALSLASFLTLQDGKGPATTPAVTGQDDASGGNALPEEADALPDEAEHPTGAGMVPFVMPASSPVVAVAGAPAAGGDIDPVMTGAAAAQHGASAARPAMLAGTGLALVQTATAAADTPATIEVPPTASARGVSAATTAQAGADQMAVAPDMTGVRREPVVARAGSTSSQGVIAAGQMTPSNPLAPGAIPDMVKLGLDSGAGRAGTAMPQGEVAGTIIAQARMTTPNTFGNIAAMPIPARFVTPAVDGVAPITAAATRITGAAALPIAAGNMPVPARFAVAAASEGATVPVASDAGIAMPPHGTGVAQGLPASVRPAATDGAAQTANVADRGVALPVSPPAEAAAPIKAGDAAPAFQVFASALHRDAGSGDAGRGEDRRAPADALAASGIVAPATTVAPVMAAQDAPLDMRQDQWPQAMIDRIEALRDQVDANDTRIRLVPDALGAIDIAISRRDDQVHVRFEAEQAQTRAMLAQAQPELNALATARGLKLGETATDGRPAMTGGQDMGQNPGQDRAFTQQQQQPRTMRNRASGATAADSAPDTPAATTRIA